MKVLVLGAGVIGVTTAYQLARNGHEVTVLDPESAAHIEAEGRDAGLVCPSHAEPWAAPGMRARTVHWVAQPDGPVKFNRPVDVSLIRWIMMWAGQCNPERYAINRRRMHRLARYSLYQLQALRRSLDIRYDNAGEGALQILRTQEEVKTVGKLFPLLDELGIPYTALERVGCLSVEPALEHATTPFLGGLYLPMDETGDCAAFTRALAAHAASLGVQFLHDHRIGAALTDGDRIIGISSDDGVYTADRYVLTLGAGAVPWLHENGYVVPVQRVKTYALSAPLADASRAPRGGIIDERNKLWISRSGNRIHVAGMSELNARQSGARGDRCRVLGETLDRLFPGAADLTHASVSDYMQAATPDSTPVLGPGHYSNLYFNLGHGFHTWTMACGAAKITADLIGDRQPEIDLHGLSYERYRR